MKAKEKAKELVDKFQFILTEKQFGKQCALITVDEILDSYTKEKSNGFIISDKIIPYWEEVKQEIELL